MSNIVTINGVQSARITYKGRPVCTTQQLAQFYGCSDKNIGDNHANNRDRFEEAKHFIKLEGSELQSLRSLSPDEIGVQISSMARSLILWTELGAARHAKMLTTEKAWNVFEEMEHAYFRIQSAPALPATYAEALRLLADKVEETQRIEDQRDKAIATKAEIGSRREATSMATASVAVRQVNRLRHELGRNQHHATILAVEKATARKFGPQGWRPLKKWCDAHDRQPESVTDPRYGEVKAWPADAWGEVYGIDLEELFPDVELEAA